MERNALWWKRVTPKVSYGSAQNAQIGIQKWCPYRYWHYTLVQYQYGRGPLPVMAFNSARSSTGIFALWFSTSMGRFYYWYWQSMMPVPVLVFFAIWFSISMGAFHYWLWHSFVPVPVLALLHFGSVPVWAWTITRTGIQWCLYWYWHFGPLIQFQYGHIPLLALALNGASTGIDICGFWSSTSIGTIHYRYWH